MALRQIWNLILATICLCGAHGAIVTGAGANIATETETHVNATITRPPGLLIPPTTTGDSNSETVIMRRDNGKNYCGPADNVCYSSLFGDCCSVQGHCGSGADSCTPAFCDLDRGHCYGAGQGGNAKPKTRNVTSTAHAIVQPYLLNLIKDIDLAARMKNESLSAAGAAASHSRTTTSSGIGSHSSLRSHSTVTRRSSATVKLSRTPDQNNAKEKRGRTKTDVQIIQLTTTIIQTPIVVALSQPATSPAFPYYSSANSSCSGSTIAYATLTDPLNPNITWVQITCISSAVNNTSIDTDSHINISTFVASMPSSASSGLAVSIASSLSSNTVSDVVVVTSSTSSSVDPSGNGMMGFTGAVTSSIGKSSSSDAIKFADIPGLFRLLAATVAMGACFGIAMLL